MYQLNQFPMADSFEFLNHLKVCKYFYKTIQRTKYYAQSPSCQFTDLQLQKRSFQHL